MNDVFYLTDDQRMIRDLARKVAREKIAPHAAEYDEAESYPEKSMRALVDSGLFGIWVPEEFGGTNMGCLALSLVAEELGWACAGTTTNFGAHPLGGLPILLSGTTEKQKNMGSRCSPTVALPFTDCEVPVEQRLGDEGEGFKIAMQTLDMTRPMTGAMAVGIGQAALDAAVAYAKERQQFGQAIAAFQGIQFMLADMAMQVHAARLMVHHAARQVDLGMRGNTYEASMAKCWAGDAAMKVATDAVQVFGGYGFMRDAKIMQIYEGTNQIQRVVIARELLGS